MNTHETYVSLEVAKLLKEAGFDWECHASYQNGEFTEFRYSSYFKVLIMDFNNAPDYMNQYSAPTLDVAQRWLREVKKLYIEIQRMPKCDSFDRYFTSIAIMQESFDTELRDKDGEKIYISGKTYKEAQEAGNKKALELILEEKK